MTNVRTPRAGRAKRLRDARWPRVAAGWTIAAVFVWLAFRRVPVGAVATALTAAAPGPLLVALAALAADFTLRITRWWSMLRALEPGLPFTACIRPYLGGIAVNNTMPFRAGDVLRAFGFRRALRAPPAAIVGTLLIERVLDMVILLGVLFIGLLGLRRGTLPAAFLDVGVALGALGVLGLLAIVLIPSHLRRLAHGIVHRLPVRRAAWRARLAALVDDLFAALGVVRSPARALTLVGLTATLWLLEGCAYAAVAWSLHIGGSRAAPWFALPTATLATLLPSSPGYVGTFDYFAVLGLVAYGASRVAALTFALLMHLLLWLPVTTAGAIALLGPGARARAARRAARQAAIEENSEPA